MQEWDENAFENGVKQQLDTVRVSGMLLEVFDAFLNLIKP